MQSNFKYFVPLLCLSFIEGSFRCDYKYSFMAKAWFKPFVVPATWSDARLQCALEGASLASPTTLEIKSALIQIIKESALKQEIFTGIHATLSQGDYHSIEGTPLLAIPVTWAENEPDNKNNKERCITFDASGDLADRRCDDLRPYICYRPENQQDEANECGTLDPEYHLDNRTNKCYKFHLAPRNFFRASLTCSAEGGHLAVINSETEATVLKELFATIKKTDMHGMLEMWKNAAFIGFYDWGEHGDWRTINGQTLSAAGYSTWGVGGPIISAGEFCGSLWRDGFLKNVWCDGKLAFICEKSPHYPAVCRADQPSLVRYSNSQCG